jgi:hypothetical protein
MLITLRADIFGIPLGTYLMRSREPMKIKGFAALHNLILFALSLYMAVECWRCAVANFGRPEALANRPRGARGFMLFGNPNDPKSPDGGDTFSESGHALARVLYIHYVSKV